MKSYRDFLDERKVPRGPWCVLELNNKVDKSTSSEHNDVTKKGVAPNVPDRSDR